MLCAVRYRVRLRTYCFDDLCGQLINHTVGAFSGRQAELESGLSLTIFRVDTNVEVAERCELSLDVDLLQARANA
jgi:hypothetical protein